MWVSCCYLLPSNAAYVWHKIDRYHPLRSLHSDLPRRPGTGKNCQEEREITDGRRSLTQSLFLSVHHYAAQKIRDVQFYRVCFLLCVNVHFCINIFIYIYKTFFLARCIWVVQSRGNDILKLKWQFSFIIFSDSHCITFK